MTLKEQRDPSADEQEWAPVPGSVLVIVAGASGIETSYVGNEPTTLGQSLLLGRAMTRGLMEHPKDYSAAAHTAKDMMIEYGQETVVIVPK